MTLHRTGRGRPKGTGLDDTTHIAAIAEMIAANPDLKPTTAIKELGISDPSVIRRLRDKYQASLQAFGAAENSAQISASNTTTHAARSIAAAQSADPRRSGPAVSVDKSARTPSELALGETSLARMFGLGFGLFLTGLEAQASLLAYGIKSVPVGSYFQTQVMLTEAALQFAAECISAPGQLS